MGRGFPAPRFPSLTRLSETLHCFPKVRKEVIMKPVSAFFCNDEATLRRVWRGEQTARAASLTDLSDVIVSEKNAAEHSDLLEKVEIIFSTWGMPVLPEELIDRMKKLRVIFYAASSVKTFAEPYLKRGAAVVPAAFANGEFVARFAMSEIFLSGKNYYRKLLGLPGTVSAHGSHQMTVGVIGAGNIGRLMIRMLLAEGHRVLVYDPYLHEDLGAEQVTLEKMFAEADIVTNHAPNTPETEGMLGGKLFASMKPGATFVNTGRGATVKEDELCGVFASRPDLTALLDVTFPEPPVKDSPITKTKNILLTPHIAGAIGTEVTHMADWCLDEYEEFAKNGRCGGQITFESLPRLS